MTRPEITALSCGGRARFFPCGWRCDKHRPGRRPNNLPSKEIS